MTRKTAITIAVIAAIFSLAFTFLGQDAKPHQPIALYKHTGKYILYIDPQYGDIRQPAFALADKTQAERSLPFNGPVKYEKSNPEQCLNCEVANLADPLQEMRDNDKKPDDFQNAANGYKVHIVGTFKYRESEDKDGLPAICVPIPGAPVGSPPPNEIEACYLAFPRTPSVLDMVQKKGNNKAAFAFKSL